MPTLYCDASVNENQFTPCEIEEDKNLFIESKTLMLAIYRKVFQLEMKMQRPSNQTKIFGVPHDMRASIEKHSLGLTVR